MPTWNSMIYDGAVASSVAALLYAVTVTAAALTALFAQAPSRRRNAIRVLQVLLRRREE